MTPPTAKRGGLPRSNWLLLASATLMLAQPALARTSTLLLQPPSLPGSSQSADRGGSYFEVEEVDTPPRLLGEVGEIYPARARAMEVEGWVVVELLINEQGEIDRIGITGAQPPGYFEEAALAMMGQRRFAPAIRQGRAVKSRWQTTLNFSLQD